MSPLVSILNQGYFFVSSCVILPFVRLKDVLLGAKAPLGLLSGYTQFDKKVANSSAFVAVVKLLHLLRFADFHTKQITRRTTTSERKKFLQLIASFR